ncbi:MAG: AMP-binding protein [Planctomycetota bacterium]
MPSQQSHRPLLTEEFVRSCKKQRFRPKAADSSGLEVSGGQMLMRTLILRRFLRREILADGETNVGILLPPSVPALAVNAALSLDHRVAVNLNYTASPQVIDSCIERAGIRHVLTSRRVMSKLGIQLNTDLIMLEDVPEQLSLTDKLAGFMGSYVVPAGMLVKSLRLNDSVDDDMLTLVFTSGSTALPKGVMLTYRNIASNVAAIREAIDISNQDVLLGILPFFHSFGYTVTMWTVLSMAVKGAYHFNPLDARQVGALCREHGVTIMLSTPTFLRSYLRRCDEGDFATTEVIITGAERLPSNIADAFERKFHVRPLEGYGCTETAPVVAANVPQSRSGRSLVSEKPGTVGRPLPGVSAKVTHLESNEECGPNETGMLWVKGPNVMKGYLHAPEMTAEAIQDGWYMTGDLASIDEDGFIRISGRQSRFSKIGGEMVPHVYIEEQLTALISGNDEEINIAVTAVPDEKKGERLVVLYCGIEQSPAELCKGLLDAGLPQLYVPSPDSFLEVEEIPVLGSGKLHLKRVREIANEHFGPADEAQ